MPDQKDIHLQFEGASVLINPSCKACGRYHESRPSMNSKDIELVIGDGCESCGEAHHLFSCSKHISNGVECNCDWDAVKKEIQRQKDESDKEDAETKLVEDEKTESDLLIEEVAMLRGQLETVLKALDFFIDFKKMNK